MDLEEFLNGSKGVDGLDLARAYVSLEARNAVLEVECNRLLEQSMNFAAVAEMAQGQGVMARERLGSICEALANMHAGLVEFLK